MSSNASKAIFLLILAIISCMGSARDPMVEDFELIYNMLFLQLENDNSLGRELVRLSFHDTMGTLDAYVDVRNSDHDGLEFAVSFLNTMWDGADEIVLHDDELLVDTFDKADFFAWAYVAAFYFFVDENQVPWVPLQFGYSAYLGEIETSPEEEIPPMAGNGSGNHTAVLEYFEELFGFDEDEVATILGAHTLGGAERQNSGYINDWTDSPNSFSKEYYETLVDPPGNNRGWEQIEVVSDLGGNVGAVRKFQWVWGCGGGDDDDRRRRELRQNERQLGFFGSLLGLIFGGKNKGGGGGNRNCRDLMLNVDMNLFFELEPYMDVFGEVRLPDNLPSSAPNFCGRDGRIWADCFPQRTGSGTRATVNEFRANGDSQEFVNRFAAVFGKMLSRVEDGIVLTEVSQPGTWPPVGFETRPSGNDRGGRNGDNDRNLRAKHGNE